MLLIMHPLLIFSRPWEVSCTQCSDKAGIHSFICVSSWDKVHLLSSIYVGNLPYIDGPLQIKQVGKRYGEDVVRLEELCIAA